MEQLNSFPVSARGGSTVALAAVLFASLSVIAAIKSDGFHDADGATHYAYARQAIHHPGLLVDIWAKPLTTALFTVPAALAGRLGVRIASLCCALICALTAWRLAILQGYRRPALAVVFTLGQPMLFLYSFSEMTELPFAATAGLAFLAYRRRQWWLLALLGSLLPLGRPEGFGFCALIAVALILHRRAIWLLLLPLPLIAWSYAGWIVDDRHGVWWLWLLRNWPYASHSDYARGPLLHFVLELPVLVSPVALPALLIGIARGFKHKLTGPDHASQCQWLIAFIPCSVLVAHSLFYWLGRFSSDGELRYLLIAAPFWGLLAADGWDWMFARASQPKTITIAACGLFFPVLVNCIMPVVPQHMGPDWQSAQRLLAWYRASDLQHDYPRLIFAHPAFDYYLNTRDDDPIRATACSKISIAARPAGYVLIWDADFSTHNADPSRDVSLAEILSAGWKEIAAPPGIGWNWRLFLSGNDAGNP